MKYNDAMKVLEDSGWKKEGGLQGRTEFSVIKKFQKLAKEDKICFIEFNFNKDLNDYEFKSSDVEILRLSQLN